MEPSNASHSLRRLPGVDALLHTEPLRALAQRYGLAEIKAALRALQNEWRATRTAPDWAQDPAAYAIALEKTLRGTGYRSVFNLTGTLLHTNLGRAPLPAAAFDATRDLVTRPMNLEFDLASGERGERETPVTDRLKRLTGAEAATVVNNCAAALMLVLNTFALGRRVPVSRGELIEIGGSFRLPEIMTRSGCALHEVGATNRTHLHDYAEAISAETGLLLKVYPSNYRIEGFASSPGVRELAELAHARGLPFCVDIGSGALLDLRRWGLPHEATPGEILAQGADLVICSGDKLLGAVQSGLILGRADLVEACRRNPMKRALRADKVTLALLDYTLGLYEDPARLEAELPLFRWLETAPALLLERGERVLAALGDRLAPEFRLQVEESRAEMGSGALPEASLDSRAVVIDHNEDRALRALQDALRCCATPVIGRLHRGRLWLDLRGADPIDALVDALATLETPT